MQWSKYNFSFKSKRNGYLLYNSQSNTFVKTNKEFHELVNTKLEIEYENIDLIPDFLIDNFIRKKIIVTDRDQYINERRFKYYSNSFHPTTLGLAIAPTSDCNFACPYCYEEGNKAKKYLDEEMEDKIISFINQHKIVTSLVITWYGGEPLMGFKSIKSLLNKIKDRTNKHLQLNNMPTNGYLLNEEKSLFFKEFPLTSIQISIDGDEEYHNKTRILKNGQPTYKVIIHNIKTFIKHNPTTPVHIRINVSKHNKHIFAKACKELKKEFPQKNVRIYPGYVKDFSSNCNTPNCSSLSKKEYINFYKDIKNELDPKSGEPYVSFYSLPATGGCGTTMVNYYVIGPEGELYKCWNDLGVKEAIVGYVDNENFTNYELMTRYITGPAVFDDPKCRNCKILPICEGGCIWLRHKNLYERKNYDYVCNPKIDCLEDSLEEYFEEIQTRVSGVEI